MEKRRIKEAKHTRYAIKGEGGATFHILARKPREEGELTRIARYMTETAARYPKLRPVSLFASVALQHLVLDLEEVIECADGTVIDSSVKGWKRELYRRYLSDFGALGQMLLGNDVAVDQPEEVVEQDAEALSDAEIVAGFDFGSSHSEPDVICADEYQQTASATYERAG